MGDQGGIVSKHYTGDDRRMAMHAILNFEPSPEDAHLVAVGKLAEFILDAVAPAIAARALREFAARMESAEWTHRDDWNVHCAYAFEVENRADEIEGAS